MTSEKKNSIKKLAITLLMLAISFVVGWMAHGIQSLYTSNYYMVITDPNTGKQHAIPVYGSGWSRGP